MRIRMLLLAGALFIAGCEYRIALLRPTDTASSPSPSLIAATPTATATAAPLALAEDASPTPRRPSSSTPSPTFTASPTAEVSPTSAYVTVTPTASPTLTVSSSATPRAGRRQTPSRTPRPRRTPTPTRTRRVSPTPTRRATLEPQVRAMRIYALEASTTWEILYGATIEMRELLREVYPNLSDEEWAERLVEALFTARGAQMMLAGMTPPASAAEVHTLLVEGTKDCGRAASLILDAFTEEEVDEVKVNAGMGLQDGCLLKVERMAASWEEAVAIADQDFTLKTDTQHSSSDRVY